MKLPLLGGLTAAEFLATYWQKKPLLIRGAIPDFRDPLSRDELAGLATELGVRARLVQERGGKKPWQLRHGPFSDKVLRSLPRSHWTLLVSQVELWSEPCALLLDRFDFIPQWRADDLMISFAPPDGSVGPHVDSYDVFLLQGQGQRRWEIQTDPDLTWRPGLDLRLLETFVADASWTLSPGDMLYLPPGIAHHGVALDECLTYSIGFRAPVQQDLIAELYNLAPPLQELVASEELFTDPDLEPQRNPGELSPTAISRLRSMITAPLDHPTLLPRWFGAFLTRPAPSAIADLGRGRRPTAARLDKLLKGQGTLWRSDTHRLLFLAPLREEFWLFVHGEEWLLPVSVLPLVERLCSGRRHTGKELAKTLPRGKKRSEGLDLIARLVALGACYFGS